jgi:hypothetical protein
MEESLLPIEDSNFLPRIMKVLLICMGLFAFAVILWFFIVNA